MREKGKKDGESKRGWDLINLKEMGRQKEGEGER